MNFPSRQSRNSRRLRRTSWRRIPTRIWCGSSSEKLTTPRAVTTMPFKYTKSAELDPPNAATAWRNFGISLYNANRLGDAVEPFKKSAELDPKNAQTWYLLGASLVFKMTTKKVGDREVVQFAPGTIEAYQKAVELDPTGTWGQQAKQGLEQLQLMAPGIDTKVNMKKKKS